MNWMANLALANDDTDPAVAEADEAIALENDALDAMAIHAAVELLADRSPDAWFAKIQAINPGYGEAYATSRISSNCITATKTRSPTTARRLKLDPRLLVGAFRVGDRPDAIGQGR